MNSKKSKVLLIITISMLVLLVGGATYAFFQAQYGSNADANVDVATKTVDQLSFRMFNAIEGETPGISITATQENFNKDDRQNATGTTYGTATFTANNATADKENPDEITATYNMYVDISANDFEYTTEGENPPAELILTVKVSETGNDADMREITTIEGLGEPVTVEGVTGFDVTTVKRVIKIAEDKEIKALSGATTTHKWEVTLTFVNLNSNQNDNTNKTFSAELLMQKEKKTFALVDVCNSGDNLASCMSSMTLGEKYGLYHHNGTITTKSLGIDENNTVLDASDNSYRYAGANPFNYVCFGYDDPDKAYAANWCPDDNLYRIIGVFNDDVIGTDGNITGEKEKRVKLLKRDPAGANLLGTDGEVHEGDYSYCWNCAHYSGDGTKYDNDWRYSELNKTNLNKNYLANLGDDANKIAKTRWYVGGLNFENGGVSNAKIAYNYELGAYKTIASPFEPYDAKIGLVYLSEYYYAAEPEYWTLPGFESDENDYRKTANENWIHYDYGVWTITRIADSNDSIFVFGNVGLQGVQVWSFGILTNPTFSLLNSVTYAGGTGSASDPIRIG